MLRFIAYKPEDGTAMLFIGLEHENLRRMINGSPVFVDLAGDMEGRPENIDISKLQVLIFAGKDAATMLADIKKHGLDVINVAERVRNAPDPHKPPEGWPE